MATSHPLSERYAYSIDQLRRYLRHVSFPTKNSESLDFARQDAFNKLALLQKHQLSAVPFDSLILHYSQHHTVSLDEAALYEKIVGGGEEEVKHQEDVTELSWLPAKGGKGGYCMENNAFFAAVLRGLGYDVVTCGARVSWAVNGTPGGGYSGW